jgi:hypothetical protein
VGPAACASQVHPELAVFRGIETGSLYLLCVVPRRKLLGQHVAWLGHRH